MAFAHNIGGNFLFVGEADAGNFTKGGIRFLWSHGFDDEADAPFLGIVGLAHFAGARVKIFEQSRALELFGLGMAAMADELVNSWHDGYCNIATRLGVSR